MIALSSLSALGQDVDDCAHTEEQLYRAYAEALVSAYPPEHWDTAIEEELGELVLDPTGAANRPRLVAYIKAEMIAANLSKEWFAH